ncbi:ATP-binding protein [Scytonema sp. NUACC26]|uniref:ATP-binding protein n=1 Tax=Scytonema sp. NUACC26 TaxID=3140176 RepID=UPI0034DCB392
MNILANAIDAIEDSFLKSYWSSASGKIPTITIRTELTSSEHILGMIHDRVVVQIQDNGLGMTEEVKQKIFDHLFTTKEVSKGMGLGLAISRRLNG